MDEMLAGVQVGALRLDDPTAAKRNISVSAGALGVHANLNGI